MKKIIVALALTLTMTLATSVTNTVEAQNLYYNGKNVKLKFPRGISASSEYMFPTFYYNAPQGWDDTIPVVIHNLETYIKADSLLGTTLINVTNDDYVLPGAKLWLELATNTVDTARTVYFKYGTQTTDTISVTNLKIKRGPYIWNGTRYEYFPK